MVVNTEDINKVMKVNTILDEVLGMVEEGYNIKVVNKLEDELGRMLSDNLTYSDWYKTFELTTEHVTRLLSHEDKGIYESGLLVETEDEYNQGEFYSKYVSLNVKMDVGGNVTNNLRELEDILEEKGLYPSAVDYIVKDYTRIITKIEEELKVLVTEDIINKVKKYNKVRENLGELKLPKRHTQEYKEYVNSELLGENPKGLGYNDVLKVNYLNEVLRNTGNDFNIVNSNRPGFLGVGCELRDKYVLIDLNISENMIVVETFKNKINQYYNPILFNNVEDSELEELGLLTILKECIEDFEIIDTIIN